MIRVKKAFSDLAEDDLLLPVRKFPTPNGYEYEDLERMSDGRRFRIRIEQLADDDYFEDAENDVFENAGQTIADYISSLKASL